MFAKIAHLGDISSLEGSHNEAVFEIYEMEAGK